MNWFFATVRAIGASFPVASSMVQLNAELDSATTQDRLRRLEDPVSAIHPDVRGVARLMYDELSASDATPLRFNDPFFERYRRAIALLEAGGCVRGTHGLSKQFVSGIYPSPPFVAYMCALFEIPAKMDRLAEYLDSSPRGTWLRGSELAPLLQLPLPVLRAMFELYSSRGLGLLSREMGTANYCVQA